MNRTIQCQICGVVLNLPPNAAGRRLKCPKCGTKFAVDAGTPTAPAPERSDHDADPASSQDIPRRPADLPLPSSPGDLRETFELPLLNDLAAAPAATKAPAAGDALALFEEKKSAPRRPNAAEARARVRRCPTCGGVVPVGMSICSTCGLDLETGTRVDLEDDLAPPPPPPSSGPPLPVTVIALVSFLGSILLAILSTVKWWGGAAGWEYFIPVCLFGTFAALHLLRGHSAKLLLAALTLGAVIDVVALIGMPIYQANEEMPIVTAQKVQSDDPDVEPMAIQSITDRLDSQRITWGIAIVMLYAAVSVYLVSPPVRRYYARH